MPLLRSRPDLLGGFRRGDRAALAEVYWAYVGRVERIIRYGHSMVNKGLRVDGAPRDQIADLVQETFLRAFEERARLAYDGKRDYAPYLATIARNLLTDRARKQGREQSLDELTGESGSFEAAGAVAVEEEEWADAETMRVVGQYLAALDQELLAVHRERYEKARSQEDAAAALGLTRQQLRTREGRLREGLALALRAANVRG